MINSIVSSWWSWMVTTTWQVSLLVVMMLVVDRLIRNWAWPQVRHALWLLVLVKLVIPPGCSLPTAVIPGIGEQLAGVVSAGKQNAHEPDQGIVMTTASPGIDMKSAKPMVDSASAPSTRWWPGLLFAVWLIGVVVFATVLLRRTSRLARWHREHEERPTIPEWFYQILIRSSQRLNLERVPAIVFSKEAVTPAVYGVFRPVLLLPSHYTDTLDENTAEHVLLHELAHLKRGDLLVQGLVLALQVIYWFNPFVIVARRQIKHIREICCDLTVASHLEEETMAYRKTLLNTARALLTESVQPSMGLLGVFEEPYKVVSRMHWLEQNTWQRHKIMLATAVIAMLLAAPFVLPMAAVVPHAVARDEPITSGNDVASPTSSPTYFLVRNTFRKETVFFGIVVDSQQLSTSRMWIGKNIIAGTERNRTTIVDHERSMITFIDHGSEIWIEAPLPLEVTRFLSPEMQRKWRGIRTTGQVQPTRKTDRLLGRKCKMFDITSWFISGGGELENQTSYSVWTTMDVPFDLRIFDSLLLNLRLIYNRDAEYRKELEKMPGLQMKMVLRQGGLLGGRRFTDEVVEITPAIPPVGTFSPPEGYRQVYQIDDLDL